MMPQMNSEEQSGYGHYEGNPPYNREQQYGAYDDNLVEALAQRIAQRVPQGSQGKVLGTNKSDRMHPGLRLALAIVSVVALIPLAGILIAGTKGVLGLVAFGIACAAVFLINAVFNALR